MKKLLKPWYAKVIAAVLVLTVLIYISKDEFKKGLAEGRAKRAQIKAEKAAKDSMNNVGK